MNSMMQFEGVAGVLALIALIVFFVGFKFLASSSWIMGWLRGNLGMAFVLLAAAIVLFLLDVRTYKPMYDDNAIATISFAQISPDNYQMRLVDVNGIENRYSLSGDHWIMSINQFKWSTRFLGLGLGHGYRISTVGGIRSRVGKDEGISKDVVVEKSKNMDSWQWVRTYIPSDFFVTAALIKLDAEPMITGAIYEIVPSGSILLAKAINDVAITAKQAATLTVLPAAATLTEQVPSPVIEQLPQSQVQPPAQ